MTTTTKEKEINALKALIREVVNEVIRENEYQKQTSGEDANIIRGLSGLAKYLNVSVPTAQKLKKAQVFPSYQWGRILVFKKNEVLTGMASKKKSKL